MPETLKVTNGIVQCPVTSTGLPVRHNESIERCKYCSYVEKLLLNEQLMFDVVICSFIDSCQESQYPLPKNL